MTRENLILEAERNLVNGYKKYGSKFEKNAFLNRSGEYESIKQPYTMRHKRNVDDDDHRLQGNLTTQLPGTPLEQKDADATAKESQREPAVQLEQGSENTTSSAPEASFTQTTESLPSLSPTPEHNASSADSGQKKSNPITVIPSIVPITEATQTIIKDLSDTSLNTTVLVPDQSEVWHNNLAITIPSGVSIFLVIFGLFFVSIKLLRKKLKSRKFKLESKEDAKASVELNPVSKSEEIELNEMV